jgi:hypothetical protein
VRDASAARPALQPVASPATLVRLAGRCPSLELLVASYRGVTDGRRVRRLAIDDSAQLVHGRRDEAPDADVATTEPAARRGLRAAGAVDRPALTDDDERAGCS